MDDKDIEYFNNLTDEEWDILIAEDEKNRQAAKDEQARNRIDNRNKQRLKDRAIDELIGICRGVLFDGAVTKAEAENLLDWLNANPLVAEDWIGKKLHWRLKVYLSDDIIDNDEEAKLLDSLIEITGVNHKSDNGSNTSTSLPLTENPPDEITIPGHHFALTGNFSHAKRKDVEKLILENGGFVKKNANSNCHYLVIGEIGSGAWIHSSFGRKIEEAVNVRDAGHPIVIITEEYFFKVLKL